MLFLPVASPADTVLPVVAPAELDDEGLLRPEYFPTTIAEAVDWNLRHLTATDLAAVQRTPRRDLGRFDRGWGSYLRKNFGLSRANRRLTEACGALLPEACDMKIIDATWERLQHPAPATAE